MFFPFDIEAPGTPEDLNTIPTFNAFQPEIHASSPQTVLITPPHPAPAFKKTKWTPAEDELLVNSVKKNGMSNWSLVAKEVPGRNGKQCRERWTNQLCPSLNKDTWTDQEIQILIKQQAIHGNYWSKIAKFLPGRAPNAVKNKWAHLSRHRAETAALARQMARSPFPMPQVHRPPAFSAPGVGSTSAGSAGLSMPLFGGATATPNILSGEMPLDFDLQSTSTEEPGIFDDFANDDVNNDYFDAF